MSIITPSSGIPEFAELQDHNKLLKLLGAGFLQTHASNLNGLDIQKLINLPIRGNQLFSVGTDFNFDPPNKSNLFDSITIINKVLENINENTDRNITPEKHKIKYKQMLSLNGITIIKDNCHIDSNTKTFKFILPDTILIENILASILHLYINELFENNYSNYDVIDSYINKEWDIDDEDNSSWIGNLLIDFKVLLDWELGIVDEASSSVPLFSSQL